MLTINVTPNSDKNLVMKYFAFKMDILGLCEILES